MRADTKRNYDKLVATAGSVFREQGYVAPLDALASRAGVGSGTLYRHFATRGALIDAATQDWVASVGEAAENALVHGGRAPEPADGLVRGIRCSAHRPQGRGGEDHQCTG